MRSHCNCCVVPAPTVNVLVESAFSNCYDNGVTLRSIGKTIEDVPDENKLNYATHRNTITTITWDAPDVDVEDTITLPPDCEGTARPNYNYVKTEYRESGTAVNTDTHALCCNPASEPIREGAVARTIKYFQAIKHTTGEKCDNWINLPSDYTKDIYYTTEAYKIEEKSWKKKAGEDLWTYEEKSTNLITGEVTIIRSDDFYGLVGGSLSLEGLLSKSDYENAAIVCNNAVPLTASDRFNRISERFIELYEGDYFKHIALGRGRFRFKVDDSFSGTYLRVKYTLRFTPQGYDSGDPTSPQPVDEDKEFIWSGGSKLTDWIDVAPPVGDGSIGITNTKFQFYTGSRWVSF